MSTSTRRSFIQKNMAGGLAYALGLPLFVRLTEQSAESAPDITLPKDGLYKDIDWQLVRQQFLFPADKNYLNTASLGPSPKLVVDTVCEAMRSLETSCSHGRHLIEKTHAQLAAFLHTTPDQIAIVRNATEGMNIAARSLRLKAEDEVLISAHEHVGGAAPWLALQKDLGISLRLIELDPIGENNVQRIKEAVSAKTKVVVFSHLTCTTGLKLPAQEIVAFCRSKGIYSCVDGAQALGMIPIDLSGMQPDFYTTSGHKWLFGPKGTGVLYMRQKILETLDPVYVGAYSDSDYDLAGLDIEFRKSAQREEYGTRNTPITLGLGTAVEFIEAIGIENVAQRGRELSTYFRKQVELIPSLELLTPEDESYSASILTFRIKNKDNLKLNQQLSAEKQIRLRGIYENDLNAIRVSFAIFNNFNEIDSLVKAIKELT